jgi:hypothetical protein
VANRIDIGPDELPVLDQLDIVLSLA